MRVFTSVSVFELKGRGRVYVTKLDKTCFGFKDLVEAAVRLDGRRFKVRAVESSAHGPPWRKDEAISLMGEFQEEEHEGSDKGRDGHHREDPKGHCQDKEGG